MTQIKLHDKEFRLFIPYEKIKSEVERIAEEINVDLKGKNPLFVGILNGSFMFASELFKRISLLDAEISFVKLASYEGDSSMGNVKKIIGFNEEIKDRTVIVLEDIVDTGITIQHIMEQLEVYQPKEVKVATLLLKPDALKTEVNLDYVGMEIPNDFIVGYGLDYDGLGRNLIDIYKVYNG